MQAGNTRKKSIIITYISSIIGIAINIFWGPFLIRTLGSAEYGVYQMAASFAGYLVLMNFGTGTVMTRYVSIYRGRKDAEGESNFIALCLCITGVLATLIAIVGIGLFAVTPKLYSATLTAGQLQHTQVLICLVVANIIITLLYQAFDGIILAYEQYQIGPTWNLMKQIVRVVLIYILVVNIPNSLFICIVDVALSCAYLAFTVFYIKVKLSVRWKLERFDKVLLWDIATFSTAIFLQAFVNQVNANVDKTLLGALVSPEAVSIYSLAMSISTIFSTLSTAILGLYLPQFTHLVVQKVDGKTLMDAAAPPCRIQFIISGTVLAGFALCGRDFVTVWIGAEYMQVWTIAIILMIPMFFVYVNGILVTVLDAMKRRLFRSVMLSLGAVCNILVTIVLIEKIGVIGAPIGTAITTILFSVIIMNLYYIFNLKLPILYLLKETIQGVLPCILVAVLGTLPVYFILPYGFVGLLTKGGCFLAILVSALWVYGLKADEKKMVRSVLGRLKRK